MRSYLDVRAWAMLEKYFDLCCDVKSLFEEIFLFRQ